MNYKNKEVSLNLKLFLLRLKKILLILKNPRLLRVLIKNRVLAGVEHNHIFNNDINTVIDIGANRGQFSLAALNIPNIKIFAFEPLDGPAEVFKEIFKEDSNVKLFKFAIGDTLGEVDMHVSLKDDSSSLLEISPLQNEYFPGTEEIGLKKIKVAPLKNFLSREEISKPALLKLDVQGFELQALRGCENFFEDIDYIYCECSFMSLYKNQSLVTDVVEFLISKDFKISGVFNMQSDSDGKNIQADFFFVKKYH